MTDGPLLLDSLQRERRPLRTRPAGHVRMFVCGPTVYDRCHLGHAKTYVAFDALARHLRQRGFTVRYVQNLTDVDDKVTRRARSLGVEPALLAREQAALYRADMRALRVTAVDAYAPASEHVLEAAEQVGQLLDAGRAYRSGDRIWFDAGRSPAAGRLGGGRVTDFELWRNRGGEPSWSTPLGDGRPGWHVQDTAVSARLLGGPYAVHAGAVDLVDPHHEAQLALLEALWGADPVGHWLHGGLLMHDGEKMNRGEPNCVPVHETLRTTDAATLRMLVLRHRYRSPMQLDALALRDAAEAVEELRAFAADVRPERDDVGHSAAVEQCRHAVRAALDDDFDTPGAIELALDFARARRAVGGAGTRVQRLLGELDAVLDVLAPDELAQRVAAQAVGERSPA